MHITHSCFTKCYNLGWTWFYALHLYQVLFRILPCWEVCARVCGMYIIPLFLVRFRPELCRRYMVPLFQARFGSELCGKYMISLSQARFRSELFGKVYGTFISCLVNIRVVCKVLWHPYLMSCSDQSCAIRYMVSVLVLLGDMGFQLLFYWDIRVFSYCSTGRYVISVIVLLGDMGF